MKILPATYGELIQGVTHDGRAVRAGVFNEHQVRAAAGMTLALGAAAFVYAYFARQYMPIQAVTTSFFIEFLVRVSFGIQVSLLGAIAGWMTRRRAPEWARRSRSASPGHSGW